MKRTILAAAIAFAFSASAYADHPTNSAADPKVGGSLKQVAVAANNHQRGSGPQAAGRSTATDSSTGQNKSIGDAASRGHGTAAANNGSTASASFTDTFSTSTATNTSTLTGAVSGNKIHGIGNVATNTGNSNGGKGGKGHGAGAGGARAASGEHGGKIGGSASNGTASAGTGGTGGAGGGGAGGNAGSNSVSAGTFDLSNTSSSVANSAAGIIVMSQNTAVSSLVQQNVNVQANLSLGSH
ncbi:MAG: signal peptide protein [Massilia sp.]|nr:signal peptide protein [Massilia sp.]